MEIFLSVALTMLWWICTLTILLPLFLLIKFNKNLKRKWFTFIYPIILKIHIEKHISPIREKAFELLKDYLSNRDASVPLRMLEIGVGPGSNLHLYPENSTLTALDVNEHFEKLYYKNSKKFPQITYERTVIGMAEDMHEIDDSSMDIVISTYVLCSVQSIDDVVKEVKRVLKPGGHYLFLDHIADSDPCHLRIQKMANYLWKHYFAGCNLIRNGLECIKKAGFRKVIYKHYVQKALILYVQYHVYGIATK